MLPYRQYSGGMDATAPVHRSARRRGGVACGGTRAAAVIDVCGDKRCQVTGVINGQQSIHQYIDGLIAVEVDPLQRGQAQVEAAP